jgi:hypothetical protein
MQEKVGEVHRRGRSRRGEGRVGWVGELERRSRNRVRKKGEGRCTGVWEEERGKGEGRERVGRGREMEGERGRIGGVGRGGKGGEVEEPSKGKGKCMGEREVGSERYSGRGRREGSWKRAME